MNKSPGKALPVPRQPRQLNPRKKWASSDILPQTDGKCSVNRTAGTRGEGTFQGLVCYEELMGLCSVSYWHGLKPAGHEDTLMDLD